MPTSDTLIHLALAPPLGVAAAYVMHHSGLRWTWAAATLCGTALMWQPLGGDALPLAVAAFAATRLTFRWHRDEVHAGGDLAQVAAARRGPRHAVVSLSRRLSRRDPVWVNAEGVLIGYDESGAPTRIPVGGNDTGTHALVAGATGSGKTTTSRWIARRLIEHGLGCIYVDPKGDASLCEHLRRAAASVGRRLIVWTPEGPSVYNPYAHGADTEIADKALAAERFTEPHYLRQAQRYLGHELRALRGAQVEVSLATLVRYLDPFQLEVVARRIPDENAALAVHDYLDSLTARQQRDLAGIRDRLAVLAESDAGRWLNPQTAEAESFDLLEEIRRRTVVYFRLDADRRPLMSQMLGAAIVQDLVTAVASLQAEPVPTLVVIDEFSAVAAEQVARLFGRARSAGVSLVLGAQELSDVRVPGRPMLLEQVLGNLSALIAHRQVVPASADLIAAVAGTHGAWVSARRSDGTRTDTRVREYMLHPDALKGLEPGTAAVIVHSRSPRIVRVFGPEWGV